MVFHFRYNSTCTTEFIDELNHVYSGTQSVNDFALQLKENRAREYWSKLLTYCSLVDRVASWHGAEASAHSLQLKYLPTLDEYLGWHEAPEQSTMNETWSDVNKGLPLVNEHVMGEQHSEYAAKWDMNFKFFKFAENAKDRGLGTLMSDESTIMRVVGAKSEDQESVREALRYCDENGQLVRLSKKEEARKYDDLKRQSERGNVPEGQGCSSHQGSRIIGDKEHRVMLIMYRKDSRGKKSLARHRKISVWVVGF
eukprot:Nk52_evm2s621 gene=Nk52_evmTU2s621